MYETRNILFKQCIFDAVNTNVRIFSIEHYLKSVFFNQVILTGESEGGKTSQHGFYINGASNVYFKYVAVYNLGGYALVCGNGIGEKTNFGIEYQNGRQEIYIFAGQVLFNDIRLGGKNGYVYSDNLTPGIVSIENYNVLDVHQLFYTNGQVLKSDVEIGSGDPYKRSDGADSVIEILCNLSTLRAPILEEWKYLVFEHEFEMDTTLRNYRYYVQCKAMSIALASELYLECEYIDQYVNTTTYYKTKVRSDGIIAERSDENDWTQYVEVTGIQPAVASKVRIKCYLSKYDADGRIFIDPKVVLS